MELLIVASTFLGAAVDDVETSFFTSSVGCVGNLFFDFLRSFLAKKSSRLGFASDMFGYGCNSTDKRENVGMHMEWGNKM